MKHLIASVCLILLASLAQAAVDIGQLTALAESGDADAQLSLAQAYDKGEGVAADPAKALAWYGKAADLGNTEAMVRLSQTYGGGLFGQAKDDCRSFYYASRAAELGHARAQLFLSSKYQRGLCVPQNTSLANEWRLRAAEHGEALAADLIAGSYALGTDGFEKDYGKALHWYKQSLLLESQNPTSVDSRPSDALCIAELYLRGGPGLEQDLIQGALWTYTAAALLERDIPGELGKENSVYREQMPAYRVLEALLAISPDSDRAQWMAMVQRHMREQQL